MKSHSSASREVRIRRMENKIKRLEKILGIVYKERMDGRLMPISIHGKNLVGKWWVDSK